MDGELDKTGQNEAVLNDRDGKGKFVEGHEGMGGRPKGSVSITNEIRKKLEEIPEGQQKTYLEMLLNRILKKAIVDGDNLMLGKIWAYVDGLPKQPLEHMGDPTLPFIIKILKDDGNANTSTGESG